MKATDLKIPPDALDHRRSPRDSEMRVEYAVEAGGMVLSPKRYNTAEDAYFYGCVLANARDCERYGRTMILRRVVSRRVTFGKWMPTEGAAP